MTIEEYLKKSAEEIENTLSEEDIYGGNIYLEGKRDAYREILEKLPSFEHETTLREVKEFCQKQGEDCDDNEDPCDYCPMAEKYSDSDGITFMSCGKVADVVPHDWNIDEIRRRMKEGRRNERLY